MVENPHQQIQSVEMNKNRPHNYLLYYLLYIDILKPRKKKSPYTKSKTLIFSLLNNPLINSPKKTLVPKTSNKIRQHS